AKFGNESNHSAGQPVISATDKAEALHYEEPSLELPCRFDAGIFGQLLARLDTSDKTEYRYHQMLVPVLGLILALTLPLLGFLTKMLTDVGLDLATARCEVQRVAHLEYPSMSSHTSAVEPFRHVVYNEDDRRIIKVECPGVTIHDVRIESLFNGAKVAVNRKESPGVTPQKWEQEFKFPVEDGHFEIEQSDTIVENGFLHVVFRAYTHQPRVFQVIPVFHMAARDDDSDLPALCSISGCGSEASLVPLAPDPLANSQAGSKEESGQDASSSRHSFEVLSRSSDHGFEVLSRASAGHGFEVLSNASAATAPAEASPSHCLLQGSHLATP
ncbi:unnamed protein product, partial [Polarella glacialis]